MKRLSGVVMLIGLAMLIYALSSDIAVDGMGGRRIVNQGLMHDRLVNTILSGFVILGGLLLRIFGVNFAATDGGYLKAIEELPIAEFRIRTLSVVLSVACLWLLVVMYLWPSTLAKLCMVIGLGWYTFQPKETYRLLTKLWLGVLLCALAVTVVHIFAFATGWVNTLTVALISDGVELVGSGKLPVLFGVLVFGPTVLSAVAFAFSWRQSKHS